MPVKQIEIAIINYPGALQSAVYGLQEQFVLANDICRAIDNSCNFSVEILDSQSLQPSSNKQHPTKDGYSIIVVPPSINNDFYLTPTQPLLLWLKQQNQSGSLLCSACAGAFIVAATGLLNERRVTTHWGLKEQFEAEYPDIRLDISQILIYEGDILTAGGLMSWVDLGLELVARFAGAAVMRQLGRNLVVDTGARQQRFYQSFTPTTDHGDDRIIKAQQYIHKYFSEAITVQQLADCAAVSARTLLRRFVTATGFKPLQYLQKVRIQKACDLLESTTNTVAQIAVEIGYEDLTAFRRAFKKQMGLTPAEFRKRFTSASSALD